MKNKKLLLVSQFLFGYLLPSKILYSSAAHKTNDTKKPLQKKNHCKKTIANSSSWLAPKGAVLFNWLYSPRRNLRLFTWSLSRWYLNEPPREKLFPQHLTVPGHFVSSTTYFLQPSSFFFSPLMTCLFLAEGFSNLQ